MVGLRLGVSGDIVWLPALTLYSNAAPTTRIARPPRPVPTRKKAAEPIDAAGSNEQGDREPQIEPPALPPAVEAEVGEHKKVASTQTAIQKSRSTDRASVGGGGKFRLLVAPSSGARACAIIDRLIAAVEARGWSVDGTEQGYAIAHSNLGLMYDFGLGVAKDSVEAVKWYRRAAEQGNAAAQFNLGYCHEIGDGVRKNRDEAVAW